MHEKQVFIGAYVYDDYEGTLWYGADYGLAVSREAFIEQMEAQIMRQFPGATNFQALAWQLAREGMRMIARAYVNRYIEQEYG